MNGYRSVAASRDTVEPVSTASVRHVSYDIHVMACISYSCLVWGEVRLVSEQNDASYGPCGRGFYGAVTVSERGQVVLPAQARRDLGIDAGDQLLVLGDRDQGLALMTIESLMRNLQGSSELLDQVRKHAQDQADTTESDDG